MLKNMVKGIVIGASMFALAGTAGAANYHVNLYGASAQFKYWTGQAEPFLAGYDTGCIGNVEQAEDASGKHGIAKCVTTTDTYIIRYSSKASYDGIYALRGEDPYDSNAASGCADDERLMANDVAGSAIVGGLTCQNVNLAASDVSGTTFVQKSEGQLAYDDTSSYESRSFNGVPIPSTFNTYRPIIVPFGFFANSELNFDSLSRLQAVLLFSGQIQRWDFFPGGNAKPVCLCLRHAGSGTHATLDASVMRGEGNLPIKENKTSLPLIWFNDGSGDEMGCVNENGGYGANVIAVGYADADQALKMPAGGGNSYLDTKPLDYQGIAPIAANIKNGLYDFWSSQWLFEDQNEADYATNHDFIVALEAFASDPAHNPNAYWATKDEMHVDKSSDWALPRKTD